MNEVHKTINLSHRFQNLQKYDLQPEITKNAVFDPINYVDLLYQLRKSC